MYVCVCVYTHMCIISISYMKYAQLGIDKYRNIFINNPIRDIYSHYKS